MDNSSLPARSRSHQMPSTSIKRGRCFPLLRTVRFSTGVLTYGNQAPQDESVEIVSADLIGRSALYKRLHLNTSRSDSSLERTKALVVNAHDDVNSVTVASWSVPSGMRI